MATIQCIHTLQHYYHYETRPTFSQPATVIHRSISFLQRNFLSRLENLENLSALQFLVLSRNRLSSLQGIASLPNLLALDVDHNALIDICAQELPPSLLYHPSLHHRYQLAVLFNSRVKVP